MVTYKGEHTSLFMLCEKLCFDRKRSNTIRQRVMNGWTIEDAICKPIKKEMNNPNRSKILDTITGEVYETLESAAKHFKIPKTTLSARLRGVLKNNTNLKYYEPK